jgi:hypothetical protein
MFEHMSIAQERVNGSFEILTVNGSPKRKEKERNGETKRIESKKNQILMCPNDDVSYIRRDLPTVSPNSIGELIKTYSSNTLT